MKAIKLFCKAAVTTAVIYSAVAAPLAMAALGPGGGNYPIW